MGLKHRRERSHLDPMQMGFPCNSTLRCKSTLMAGQRCPIDSRIMVHTSAGPVAYPPPPTSPKVPWKVSSTHNKGHQGPGLSSSLLGWEVAGVEQPSLLQITESQPTELFFPQPLF
jgi:hypothetical protein